MGVGAADASGSSGVKWNRRRCSYHSNEEIISLPLYTTDHRIKRTYDWKFGEQHKDASCKVDPKQ